MVFGWSAKIDENFQQGAAVSVYLIEKVSLHANQVPSYIAPYIPPTSSYPFWGR